MRTPEEIVALYHQRRNAREPIVAAMQDVKRHYEGEVRVPLPELDEAEKPAVANLVYQGIEQYAQRVASVMPDIYYPSIRPGFDIHDERARKRRLANLGWWDMNRMQVKQRRRARHMVAYGQSIVTVGPVSLNGDDKRKIPFWRIRDPLCSYPAPMTDHDDCEPVDCVFADTRPLSWLMSNYPVEAKAMFRGKKGMDGLFTVLEYVDANETVFVAVGESRKPGEYTEPSQGQLSCVLLDRAPNRTGVCPAVMASRITLGRTAGQFDQMLGAYQREAKLDALQTIAVFRAVFPDEWITGHPGAGAPKIVAEADGKRGIRGEIANGTIETVTVQPSQMALQTMDRLERTQRMNGGIPAEMGGESPTNIRTARRGEMVVGNTIDMPIQEIQEIFEIAMAAEDRRGVLTMKAYHGDKPSMFILPGDGKVDSPDYTPNEIFDADLSYVKYASPGSDINGLVISIGQRIGDGTMSTQTGMEMDPAIEDVARERDQIELEKMRAALLANIDAGLQQGSIDPMTVVRVAQRKAAKREPLEDAWAFVHSEMQKEQAAQQAQQAPPGATPPGAEQMPGANQPPGGGPPGAPGAMPPGTMIGPPPASQVNLSSILQTLRRPANQGPAERQLSQAAS